MLTYFRLLPNHNLQFLRPDSLEAFFANKSDLWLNITCNLTFHSLKFPHTLLELNYPTTELKFSQNYVSFYFFLINIICAKEIILEINTLHQNTCSECKSPSQPHLAGALPPGQQPPTLRWGTHSPPSPPPPDWAIPSRAQGSRWDPEIHVLLKDRINICH